MDAKICAGGLRNSHKVELSGAVSSRELIEKQPPRHGGSNHGRGLGRKNSSTADNYFRPRRTAVARKSSRGSGHLERYMSFRGSPQSKVTEKHRPTTREPSQFSQSTSGGSPPKGPSLDRRSIHQTDPRNRRTDINRSGAVEPKSSRVNDQTRWVRNDNRRAEEDNRAENLINRQTRKQTENSTRELTRRDDFARHPRPKSPAVIDQLDQTPHHPRNHSPVAKTVRPSTRFNGSVLSDISTAP